MHHRPTWIAAALIAATAALSSSCVAAGTSTTAVGTTPLATAGTSVPSIAPSTSVPGPLPHGPFATKTTTLTLVDRSRATPAGAQTPERPERTLETVVYEPDAAGSFPLVVFSHGLGGDPGKFTKLLTAWSGAGFVVAAPAFPLTNDHTPEIVSVNARLSDFGGDLDGYLPVGRQFGVTVGAKF